MFKTFVSLLSGRTSYAVKNLTLRKHSHMGWNTVFKLEYYDASQAYQYKCALAFWWGLGVA